MYSNFYLLITIVFLSFKPHKFYSSNKSIACCEIYQNYTVLHYSPRHLNLTENETVFTDKLNSSSAACRSLKLADFLRNQNHSRDNQLLIEIGAYFLLGQLNTVNARLMYPCHIKIDTLIELKL